MNVFKVGDKFTHNDVQDGHTFSTVKSIDDDNITVTCECGDDFESSTIGLIALIATGQIVPQVTERLYHELVSWF